jgi:curli biogenesis system outer membrane secretion channel CsgG
MRSTRPTGLALIALSLLMEPASAIAATKSAPIPSGAPREIVNPYKPALECLATQLTPEQRDISIGVSYLLDRTGRDSYSQDSAAGKFLAQSGDDVLITSLAMTGMQVVEYNPAYRQSFDWQLPKMLSAGRKVDASFPDIVISGSFSSLDFGSSKVGELYVFGIGGGARAYSIRYTMDMRATAMPTGRFPSGKVLATLALEKDVTGREKKAGVAGFFGNQGDSTYVEFNFNTQKRELLQYSQRYMISRAAFGIVANLWNIHTCDEQLAYSDSLVTGQIQEAKKIP